MSRNSASSSGTSKATAASECSMTSATQLCAVPPPAVVALPGGVQSEARALEQAVHLLAARICDGDAAAVEQVRGRGRCLPCPPDPAASPRRRAPARAARCRSARRCAGVPERQCGWAQMSTPARNTGGASSREHCCGSQRVSSACRAASSHSIHTCSAGRCSRSRQPESSSPSE